MTPLKPHIPSHRHFPHFVVDRCKPNVGTHCLKSHLVQSLLDSFIPSVASLLWVSPMMGNFLPDNSSDSIWPNTTVLPWYFPLSTIHYGCGNRIMQAFCLWLRLGFRLQKASSKYLNLLGSTLKSVQYLCGQDSRALWGHSAAGNQL